MAVLADDGLAPPSADVAAVPARAADALADARAIVVEAAPPGGHALTEEIWASYEDGAIGYELLRRWDAFRAATLSFGQD